jgi:hypothetical protein
MALGFSKSSGGGDFTAIMRYDARSGRMFRDDRKQDGSGAWMKESADMTNSFKAVFDFENIEVGYIMFPPGAAPDFRMVKIGDPFPQRPSDNHHQGFRIKIKLAPDTAGDGDAIREIAGTSAALRMGIDDLHDAYEAGKGANAGKLPIVTLKTTQPVVSGQGAKKSTNSQPVIEIIGWAKRPDDLPAAGVKQATQPAAAPSTGSTPVAPPAQKQMATADSDFG